MRERGIQITEGRGPEAEETSAKVLRKTMPSVSQAQPVWLEQSIGREVGYNTREVMRVWVTKGSRRLLASLGFHLT